MEGMAGDPAPTMRATYDRIAANYEATNRRRSPAQYPELANGFVERARAVGGAAPRAVEMGCGPGQDMAWLEGQGIRMVGVDLSAGMLGEARRQVRGPLVQADMRRLPLRSGERPGVWCSAALLHLRRADAPVALAEMARLVVAGAPLYLSLQGGAGETWEHQAYGHEVERFFARYGMEEAAALVEEAGFRVERSEREVAGARTWLRVLVVRT